MSQKIIRSFLAAMAIFVICRNGEAQNLIPFKGSLREANVTLTKMLDGQSESLIVGNGDLYGIVWEKDSSLFMRITKNDIWDARIDVSQDGEMPKVDIATGKTTGQVGGPPSYRKTYPQPRCAAALHLGPISSAKGFSANLDIEKAFVSIKSADAKNTTIRILHDRNVLLINSPYAVTLEEIKAETLPAATLGKQRYFLVINENACDIDYKGMDYALAVASKGNLKAVSLVTSFDIKTGDVLDHAIGLARQQLLKMKNSYLAT